MNAVTPNHIYQIFFEVLYYTWTLPCPGDKREVEIRFRSTELPHLCLALENDEKEVGKNVAPALALAGQEPSGTQGYNKTSLFLIVLLCSQVLLLRVQ